jgi:hypothetical protein
MKTYKKINLFVTVHNWDAPKSNKYGINQNDHHFINSIGDKSVCFYAMMFMGSH